MTPEEQAVLRADAEWAVSPFGDPVQRAHLDRRDQLERALDARPVSFSPVSPGGLVGNGSLPFAPLSTALANVPEDPVWTWRGYLAPGSITLLAGKPKVGKSTFVFGLVAALVEGVPFLELDTRASGVLLLSEEREGTLAEKSQDWSLDGRVHVLMRYQANGQEWPRVVEEAAAYCRAERLGVLVVDTWDKWTGLKGDAENNAGAVLEALEPLLAVAGAGLCVLVVSHQRKASGDFGEAVRGSNALIGGVDIVTELERPRAETLEGHGVRLLRAVSRYASTPEDLVLALTDDGYEARGDTLTAQAEAERQQVLQALEQRDGSTYDRLHEETGLPVSTIRRRLGELGERVAREGKGKRGDPFRFLTSPPAPTGEQETYDPDADIPW